MTLQEKLAAALAKGRSAIETGDLAAAQAAKQEAENCRDLIKSASDLDELETSTKSTPMRPGLPGTSGSQQRPSDSDDASTKAIYTLRFGEESAAKTAVLTDLMGTQYRQTLWDQNAAFAKYLRSGDRFLDRDEYSLLQKQIFPFEHIHEMVKNGFDTKTIKSTMVEAQGSLGGFAVPATMQSEMLRRLPGLTAVRGAGAVVVNLTTGNSTEVVEVTGGNSRYTSGLRGAWGTETQNPTEKNFTIGLKQLNADIYTYKVPFSQSLVEDAANLVTIMQEEATMTMAMDEDDAFLVGDGVAKPLGILPGGTNLLGLTEVVSGAAADVTADGIKRLKRGIAAQYRRTGVFIGASDTFGDIELLVDANGEYLLVDKGSDLTDQDMLLSRRVFESEAMPAIAASAYPLIYGNVAGYWIVERSGMTIARYQDSNTGINKVEYHFRRRVGGRVTRPWMFCVQKIAAS